MDRVALGLTVETLGVSMGDNYDVYENVGLCTSPNHATSHCAAYQGQPGASSCLPHLPSSQCVHGTHEETEGQRSCGRGGAGSLALPSLSSSGWAIGEC